MVPYMRTNKPYIICKYTSVIKWCKIAVLQIAEIQEKCVFLH